MMIIKLNTTKRILAALRDEQDFDCPALLIDLDVRRRKAKFKTKCKGPFKAVVLSRIRLGEDYKKTARGRVWA